MGDRHYGGKKPHRLNLVSGLLLLAALALGYGAYKFGPVYYMSFKVDGVLEDVGNHSIDLRDSSYRAGELEPKLLSSARNQLVELGITDPELQVYYDAGYTSLVAEYAIVVTHPVGQPTMLRFRRHAPVPTIKTGL